MKINLYDFDKTIYDGDSSVDFYLYCLKRKPSIILLIPSQFLALIKYKTKRITKEKMKETFFTFFKKININDNLIKDFWNKHDKKIKKFYLDEKNRDADVIISASPTFLLKPISKQLKVKKLLATEVNSKTGKFESLNCYGKEKVRRLKEIYPKFEVEKSYSDSLSDIPILELAKKAYLVKGSKLIEYRSDKYEKTSR